MGILFGLTGIKPVPAIIVAQALNGILLPFVALFLVIVMNDRRLLGDAVHGRGANLALVTVVLITLVLGTRGVLAALAGALGRPQLVEPQMLWSVSAVAVVGAGVVMMRMVMVRGQGKRD